jgi:hypothetical protein
MLLVTKVGGRGDWSAGHEVHVATLAQTSAGMFVSSVNEMNSHGIKNKFSLRNHKENYQSTVFPNIIFLRQ